MNDCVTVAMNSVITEKKTKWEFLIHFLYYSILPLPQCVTIKVVLWTAVEMVIELNSYPPVHHLNKIISKLVAPNNPWRRYNINAYNKRYISAVRSYFGIDCELVYPRKGNDHTERTVLKLIWSLHAYRSRLLDRFSHKIDHE